MYAQSIPIRLSRESLGGAIPLGPVLLLLRDGAHADGPLVSRLHEPSPEEFERQ